MAFYVFSLCIRLFAHDNIVNVSDVSERVLQTSNVTEALNNGNELQMRGQPNLSHYQVNLRGGCMNAQLLHTSPDLLNYLKSTSIATFTFLLTTLPLPTLYDCWHTNTLKPSHFRSHHFEEIQVRVNKMSNRQGADNWVSLSMVSTTAANTEHSNRTSLSLAS